MVAGPSVPAHGLGTSLDPSPPSYMASLYSEVGRESSSGVRSPAQELLAVARKLKSERENARSKVPALADGMAELGPASRRGRGVPPAERTSGSMAVETS